MRYIELQRALQSRLSELERLCERERSILQGRWKTHSLPARKKAANSLDVGNPEESLPPSKNLQSTYTSYCCRPASSTEHLLYYNVVRSLNGILMYKSIWVKLHQFQIFINKGWVLGWLVSSWNKTKYYFHLVMGVYDSIRVILNEMNIFKSFKILFFQKEEI